MSTDRVEPIRRRFAFGARRVELEAEKARLLQAIAGIDGRVDALRAERRTHAARCHEIDATLAPILFAHGRRPTWDGRAALPPADADAEGLYGRRLRATCRALLEEHGRLSLLQLHELLHLRGFVVSHQRPVQALASALAYETALGRVRRVARGVYERVS